MTQHAEIKLGVVFRTNSSEQQQKLNAKMRKISETLNGKNEQILAFQNPSVSELYNDDQDAHDFDPSGQRQNKPKKQNLGGLNRSEELNEPILESNMETSMVQIHGTN